MHVLSLGWLAFGLENIGTVAFRKDLELDKEFLFSLAKRAAVFVLAVPLALWLRNYWALVIGVVAGKFIAVAISFAAHPYRPRFSLKGARDLLSFSSWLLVNNILFFLNDRMSSFVIGRVSGARALGAYNLGYEISCMPTIELASPNQPSHLSGIRQARYRQSRVSVGLREYDRFDGARRVSRGYRHSGRRRSAGPRCPRRTMARHDTRWSLCSASMARSQRLAPTRATYSWR